MQCIIGVDIGTSGIKAVAFTVKAEPVYQSYTACHTISTRAGRQEMDPDLLLGAVVKTLRETIAHTHGRQLLGISFSCALHSLIAVDKNGAALTNAITWADLRSSQYASAIRNTATGNKIYEHTGTPIHPMSPLCKIMWMKDQQPEIFSRSFKFISIKEYIWFQFFGKFAVDYSIASGTGLFDIGTLNWNKDALQMAGITAGHLSEPVPTVYIEKKLKRQYSEALGIDPGPGIPFVIGGNDGCLANLGSAVLLPGEMALTIGTSGAVRMTTKHPKADPRQRIFSYLLTNDHYVCGGPVNNGGNALKWWVEHFMERSMQGENEFNAIVQEAASVPAGAEGLIFLPYLLGERAPVWDAHARAVFFGITSQHHAKHFLRAVLEGIGYSLYGIGLSLEETIGPVEHIYASGGFIQSELWLQMMADIFRKNIHVTSAADASATGAALLGLYALGEIRQLEQAKQLIRIRKTYFPSDEQHAYYQENFSVFSTLYDALKDKFDSISQFYNFSI